MPAFLPHDCPARQALVGGLSCIGFAALPVVLFMLITGLGTILGCGDLIETDGSCLVAGLDLWPALSRLSLVFGLGVYFCTFGLTLIGFGLLLLAAIRLLWLRFAG